LHATLLVPLVPFSEDRDRPIDARRRRVADPRIAKSLGFQIEQRRAMVGAVERVRDRLIDGDGDRLGRRVDFVAAVNRQCLGSHALTVMLAPGHSRMRPLRMRSYSAASSRTNASRSWSLK